MSRHIHDDDCAIQAHIRSSLALQRIADNLDDLYLLASRFMVIEVESDTLSEELRAVEESRAKMDYTE